MLFIASKAAELVYRAVLKAVAHQHRKQRLQRCNPSFCSTYYSAQSEFSEEEEELAESDGGCPCCCVVWLGDAPGSDEQDKALGARPSPPVSSDSEAASTSGGGGSSSASSCCSDCARCCGGRPPSARSAGAALAAPLGGRSLFAAALEKLPRVKDRGGAITTRGFCDLCELTLPVIESFGPAFGPVRGDISSNVRRLRARRALHPARFRQLFPLVEEEVARRDDNHSQSCTKAVLWLKRGMEFMLAIIGRLMECPDASMADVVAEQYKATLKRWHGFIASSAFKLAFNFIPSREVFLDRLAGGRFDDAAAADTAEFVARFSALLSEVHAFLDKRGLDDPAKV